MLYIETMTINNNDNKWFEITNEISDLIYCMNIVICMSEILFISLLIELYALFCEIEKKSEAIIINEDDDVNDDDNIQFDAFAHDSNDFMKSKRNRRMKIQNKFQIFTIWNNWLTATAYFCTAHMERVVAESAANQQWTQTLVGGDANIR